MYFYWILYILLALFCFLHPTLESDKNMRMSNYLSLFFIILVLILFAGLRYGSTDYESYALIYDQIPSLLHLYNKWDQLDTLHVETGFIVFSSILKIFSGKVVFLMLVMSLMAVSINFVAILKLSPYIYLSILLYFVYNFLLKENIQIRQGVASAIILLSFAYYKKPWIFLLLIFLAGFFQSTAYICLLPWAFSYFKFSKVKYVGLLMVTFLAAIVFSGRHLFEYALNLMSLPTNVTAYFGWDEFDYKLGFFNPVLLKQLFICVLLINFREKLVAKFQAFHMIFSFYFISCLWYIYFNDFAIIAGRISNLLSVGEIILVPMLLSVLSIKFRIPFYFATIILAGLLLFLNLQTGMILPYRNVLFK